MERISFLTFIDLRFLLPPLINLFLYYYLSSQREGLLVHWVSIFPHLPHSTLIMAVLLFVMVISCMSCTSVTVPFAFALGNRLSLHFRRLSFTWTASFIASFISSPGVFFRVVVPLTIIISLSQELILKLLGRFFGWLLHTLRRIPGVDVICVLNGQGHGENDTQTPMPPQFESPAQNQPDSEYELEIITEE